VELVTAWPCTRQFWFELEVGIHAADAVVPAAEFTIGEDGADG